MWKILKAELQYNKLVVLFVILFPFLIVMPYNISYYLMERGMKLNLIDASNSKGIYFLVFASSVLLSFIVAFNIVKEPEEKRDRFYRLLPVSLRQIGYSRFFFAFFIWMGLFTVFIFSHLLSPHQGIEIKRIYGLFTINSFFITIYALKCINRDLQFLFRKEYMVLRNYGDSLANGLLSIAAAGFGYFHMKTAYGTFNVVIHSKDIILKFMFSMHGAVIFNLICFGFIYLSVTLFARRKTYLR